MQTRENSKLWYFNEYYLDTDTLHHYERIQKLGYNLELDNWKPR